MTVGPIQFKKRKVELSPGDASVGHTDEDARKLVPATLEDKLTGQRLIVVLEKASLDLHFGKKGKEILNCDDHKNYIQKSGKDFAHFRPDIVHDCLKALLDSPLNKAGKLQIYIHTSMNVLIEVNQSLRIPRTYKRFAGLMAELIDKHKIRAANSRDILMRVITNPVSQYLPAGGRKIALSVNGKLQSCAQFATEVKDLSVPVTVSIGAVSTGEPSEEEKFGAEYCEQQVAVSNYGLSAAVCCSKICDAFEQVWNILYEIERKKISDLIDEVTRVIGSERDCSTARSLVRSALAFLGEEVKHVDPTVEQILNEDDFHERNCDIEGMIRKLKSALYETNERNAVTQYLRSIHVALGGEPRSGSITPRPRDYDAAISRFGESLNSPSQLRGLSKQERLEHTHSSTILKH